MVDAVEELGGQVGVLSCGLVVVMDVPVVVRLAFCVVALVVLEDDAERGGCGVDGGCS